MDNQPQTRRWPRAPRIEHPDLRPVQTFAHPTLAIVTDDPRFLEPRTDSSRPVRRWSPTGRVRGPREFTGDPADRATYAWAHDVSDLFAIIVLHDDRKAAAAAAAIRQTNRHTAIIVVNAGHLPDDADALMRPIDSHAVLRDHLEHLLEELETVQRVQALRAFAEGAAVLPILAHQDPDPDALASAQAIRVLLRRNAQDAPIVTLDEMTRPENRRMAELLDIQVTQVAPAELLAFDRILCVDMQPRGLPPSNSQRLAILDHHPPEPGYRAEYVDIRPNYGATATIVTEYLRAEDERWINEWLATGLVYAIRTDTGNLTRGVSPADLAAYMFLLERADRPLLHRIERPALSQGIARGYGRALADMAVRNDIGVAFFGEIPIDQSHILADLADFVLTIDEVTWAGAAAVVEGRLVVTLRHMGGEPGAGELAHALAQESGGTGTGGGHTTMARAVLPLNGDWGTLVDAPIETGRLFLLGRLERALERVRG